MLPPPISELVPFVIPDALLDPALLDGFSGLCDQGYLREACSSNAYSDLHSKSASSLPLT